MGNNSAQPVPEHYPWLEYLVEKWQKPLTLTQVIQPLWSNCGVLCRISDNRKSYVAKYIAVPDSMQHPKGWNGSASQQRKLMSYQVEKHFYQFYARQTDKFCQVPQLLEVVELHNTQLLVMEDLQTTGFSQSKTAITEIKELNTVIRWLAYFHMRFLAVGHQHLWAQGCYWHLDTRQEEHQAMVDGELKQKAVAIDKCLANAQYQTLLHGDAKLANFCFSDDNSNVAGIDFQYTGAGVGVKDLMILLSSSLDGQALLAKADMCLDYYFQQLKLAHQHYQRDVEFSLLEAEWRKLWPYTWADYHRFLEGWSPGHQRISLFMQDKTRQTLSQL